MIPITRLQAYLRYSAHRQYDAVSVPPFTLFFHPTDALVYFNYAIPDEPTPTDPGQDLHGPLAALRAAFEARGRQPRLEFIAEFAPHLAPTLQAAGFVEQARQPLMICTPGTHHAAPTVAGLTITTLDANSPLADALDFLTTQRQGFDPTDQTVATEQQARQWLRELQSSAALLARLDGQPVGAGMFTAPFDGITEIVGIATREPFRRRGIGAALTAHAVRTAFTRGATVACLTAADERTGHLYRRVGFRFYATMLTCAAPPFED
jgi:ribosomal protein S18 acetylase RimI-like enzyme